MAVFVIADLHLSTADPSKSMDVFGSRWCMYTERLEKNWRAIVAPDDTVILPGDLSWGMSLEGALSDFRFLDTLPGRKIVGKGNHDYWWTTMKRMTTYLNGAGISTVSFLHNNAYIADEYIIAGTRGWYQDSSCDNMPDNTDFDKLVAREVQRLRTSLTVAVSLKDPATPREIIAFLHFPVSWNGRTCQPLADVLQEFGIRRCFFGHIHAGYTQSRLVRVGTVDTELISSDFLEFIPKVITPNLNL